MTQRTRVLISSGLLLSALVALQARSAGEPATMRKSFSAFPQAVDGWRGQEDAPFSSEIVNELKVTDYLMRRYVDGQGHSAWLYVGYWQSQRKGSDIHSPKNCLPGGGWEPIEATRLTIPLPAPASPITVNHYLIQKDKQMQVVIYWFQAQGRVVPGELDAKVQMIRNAILTNRTDGALVRISTSVSGSAPETTGRLVRYVQAMYPILTEYLPN